jgi:SAM-dependent methyltransferase
MGCGSGNNLRLFYEYGWNVSGVDISATALSDATKNLTTLQKEYKLANTFEIIHDDMLHFLENSSIKLMNAVLFPSSLFYLSYADIQVVLSLIAKRVKPGGFLFFKLLTDSDYRFRNINKMSLGNSSYRLMFAETGEYGQSITFLSRNDWQILLKKFFNFESLSILDLKFEHVQNGIITDNANLICYGKLAS